MNFKRQILLILIFILSNAIKCFPNFVIAIDFQSKATKDSLNYDIVQNKTYKFFNNEIYPEALKYALILHTKNKKIGDSYQLYKSSELLGDIYSKTHSNKLSLKHLKLALKYLNNSFESKENTGATNLLAKIYLKTGNEYFKIYKELKYNDKESFHKKMIDLGVSVKKNDSIKNLKSLRDSTFLYFKKLEALRSINNDILEYKANSKITLSALYLVDSMYTNAKSSALNAIKILKKRKNKIKLAKSLSNLGSVYVSIGEFYKAKETYLEGIETVKKEQSESAIKLKANLYYNLAWAMRNLKDYKAYDYQELSYDIEDISREENLREIVKKIEANHKENLEKQKVNLIKEQRKLLEAKDSNATLLFSALSLLIIIISAVVIYNYKLRQKNLQLKLSESNLLQQQSLEKLKSETQIKIVNATIDGKETERKQIAETLHDNVSALLSSANMHLTASKKQFGNSTPQEIEKTQAIILEASQKVRDLSHNLVSSILLKFGLEYAMKDVVKKYSNSELTFKVNAQNINRYNQEFEIKIFNVIQELINNILKHSKANSAKIVMKEEKNQLTILVKDDGVGFSTSSSSINDGIGLNQIEARIHVMNGQFSVNSKINDGTEIKIAVPIQQKENKGFSLTSVS